MSEWDGGRERKGLRLPRKISQAAAAAAIQKETEMAKNEGGESGSIFA